MTHVDDIVNLIVHACRSLKVSCVQYEICITMNKHDVHVHYALQHVAPSVMRTWDSRGRMVTPAWPPTTGTVTSRGSTPAGTRAVGDIQVPHSIHGLGCMVFKLTPNPWLRSEA